MTDTSTPAEYQLQYVRPNYGARSHRMDKPITILGTELINDITVVWFRNGDGLETYRPVAHFTRTHPTLGEHYAAVDAEGNPQPHAPIPFSTTHLYDRQQAQVLKVLGTGFGPTEFLAQTPGVHFEGDGEARWFNWSTLLHGDRFVAACEHGMPITETCSACATVTEVVTLGMHEPAVTSDSVSDSEHPNLVTASELKTGDVFRFRYSDTRLLVLEPMGDLGSTLVANIDGANKSLIYLREKVILVQPARLDFEYVRVPAKMIDTTPAVARAAAAMSELGRVLREQYKLDPTHTAACHLSEHHELCVRIPRGAPSDAVMPCVFEQRVAVRRWLVRQRAYAMLEGRTFPGGTKPADHATDSAVEIGRAFRDERAADPAYQEACRVSDSGNHDLCTPSADGSCVFDSKVAVRRWLGRVNNELRPLSEKPVTDSDLSSL